VEGVAVRELAPIVVGIVLLVVALVFAVVKIGMCLATYPWHVCL
jgi:hypothetical protein